MNAGYLGQVALAHEAGLRLSVFLGVLCLMACWEFAAPRRRTEIPRLLRWSNNLALVAVDAVLVRLSFPVLAVGLAVIAGDRGWGLLNNMSTLGWVRFGLALLALDLAIYLQHVMFHAVPVLWRLHRMHHADLAFDVTTGLRFHPLEIIASMAVKLTVVAALGPPALVFEVILNASAMFNHSNIRLPKGFDRLLRLVLVTPDMHRVHHSAVPAETNSNFGFNLTWWDYLLGTHRAQPAAGHTAMTIGFGQFRARRELWLDRMLTQPLRGAARGHALAPRDSGPDDPSHPEGPV